MKTEMHHQWCSICIRPLSAEAADVNVSCTFLFIAKPMWSESQKEINKANEIEMFIFSITEGF